MSIKPSAATEIRALLAALGSGDEIKRETAIARLAIIGPRAVDRMIAAYASADADARIALLRAFESIADPRPLRLAREALAGGGDVAVAAAGTLRALLDAPGETIATDALDALVAAALNPSLERRVRLAAVEALRGMPADIRGRVEEALREDPGTLDLPDHEAIADLSPADAVWQDALDGRLPEDPATLRTEVDRRGPSAPLSVLHRLVDEVHARERAATESARRAAWVAVRGALHQALALRGSTIALYDLRETLAASSDPLPASYIAALHAVGDGSCLEVIAAAHAASAHERWRAQLEGAFKAILAREKVTRRTAAVKRIEKKWPASAENLLPAAARKGR
jgi:hypothetical protein